jgi:hypothetical protein
MMAERGGINPMVPILAPDVQPSASRTVAGIEQIAELERALRGLLAVTDHRSLNEQMAGGDRCPCNACNVARYALRDV